MLTFKLRNKSAEGVLFWEPYIRLAYGIGRRKYDILIDVGLSEKVPCSYFKILLSRKFDRKSVVEVPKSLVKGYIQEPLKTDAEIVIGELLEYAKLLHVESKKLTKSISDYAKKIHLWSKYMAYPIDEGAKWIFKLLRPQKFDKKGIFMIKALLSEGLGINEKTTREKIRLFKESGTIVHCPFYIAVKKGKLIFYDGTSSSLKESVTYTRFVNAEEDLRKHMLNVLSNVKRRD